MFASMAVYPLTIVDTIIVHNTITDMLHFEPCQIFYLYESHPCVTVCFGTPVLPADLFVLSPGYKVLPDLATVPQLFSMCCLHLWCPQRRFECSK